MFFLNKVEQIYSKLDASKTPTLHQSTATPVLLNSGSPLEVREGVSLNKLEQWTPLDTTSFSLILKGIKSGSPLGPASHYYTAKIWSCLFCS